MNAATINGIARRVNVSAATLLIRLASMSDAELRQIVNGTASIPPAERRMVTKPGETFNVA
ncbi:hypothetical protein ACERK3_09730 [Phycisphaerales bacterium AB-hyl4]|uniref:Uncharacterized protein n=1 Tax=Natronomicrosphaera hydrolytica TaxID=3242702 RepID=A0ABV4U4P9_9BACT